ncbi:unnamed protein product, partial [Coregonus sp. 'balchen']
MDRKRPKLLILRRDTVEGRMVARRIALEEDTPLSHAANQDPDLREGANQGDQGGAGVEVSGEEEVIQLENDMLPLGAEGTGEGEGSLAQGTGEGEGSLDGPPGAWFEPLGENDFDDVEGPGWKRKVVFRRSTTLSTKRKWDAYYCSPNGDRMRSKVELAKYLPSGVDLSHFDFQSGLFLDEKNRLK